MMPLVEESLTNVQSRMMDLKSENSYSLTAQKTTKADMRWWLTRPSQGSSITPS